MARGAVVESKLFKQALGLTEADLISGIIYIGTAVKAIPARTEIHTNEFVSEWHK